MNVRVVNYGQNPQSKLRTYPDISFYHIEKKGKFFTFKCGEDLYSYLYEKVGKIENLDGSIRELVVYQPIRYQGRKVKSRKKHYVVIDDCLFVDPSELKMKRISDTHLQMEFKYGKNQTKIEMPVVSSCQKEDSRTGAIYDVFFTELELVKNVDSTEGMTVYE